MRSSRTIIRAACSSLCCWRSSTRRMAGSITCAAAMCHPSCAAARATWDGWMWGAGLPWGVDEDAVYRAATAWLHPGDSLLVVSDGITEATAPDGALFDDGGVAD